MNEVKAAAPFDLVLVGYRPADTEKAIAFCNRAFGTDLVHRRVLVLNNDLLATSAKARASGWEVIQGSNVLAEFSGWQEGWAACDRARVSPGGVIFVNDSVVTHRHFTTARRLALVRSIRNASGATLVGFRDRVGGSLVVANLRVNSWASTYCFALTADALMRLGGRLYEPEVVERCAPGGHDERLFFANLSPDLNAHLRQWLFGGGWYAGTRLTKENAQRLTLKARCIIAEKLLSARCEAASVKAVDPIVEHGTLRFLDKVLRRITRWIKP